MAKWADAIREQREGPKPEAPPAVKPGRCEKCDNTSFKLRIADRILTRTCKQCGAEEIK